MKMRTKQALLEAVLICTAAAVLGIAYSAIKGVGILSEKPLLQVRVLPDGGAGPTMISLEEADSLFRSGDAVFVDTRHAFDFRRGHIAGAINVPLNEFLASDGTLTELPQDRVIVTYCDAEDCNSSIEMAGRLYERGFRSVRIFFGGWQEWTRRGLPTETLP